MLRSFVIAFGVVCFMIGAVVLFVGGAPPSVVFLVWGAVLVGGIVFERFHYKPLENRLPGMGWTRTAERFVDEETGKLVTVYIRPDTGERSYITE
jgi:cell division protein FtsW (lipid II flippase)